MKIDFPYFFLFYIYVIISIVQIDYRSSVHLVYFS